MIRLFILMTSLVILSGCNSNTSIVKNGVMDFNQTTTLGEALDNWQSCGNSYWNEFVTDNGISVVEFICEHDISAFALMLQELFYEANEGAVSHFGFNSIVQTFQFTLNQDETFQIDNIQESISWLDGRTLEIPVDNLISNLQNAYNNVPYADLEELSSMNAFESAQLNYSFQIAYERATN